MLSIKSTRQELNTGFGNKKSYFNRTEEMKAGMEWVGEKMKKGGEGMKKYSNLKFSCEGKKAKKKF